MDGTSVLSVAYGTSSEPQVTNDSPISLQEFFSCSSGSVYDFSLAREELAASGDGSWLVTSASTSP